MDMKIATRRPGASQRVPAMKRAIRRELAARSAGVSPARAARRALRSIRRSDTKTPREGIRDVTRLCRCEPLLSTQSNKWGGLRQVRLSARRRTCTVLTASPDAPGRSNLGSRGNPIHYRTPQATPSHSTPRGLAGTCGNAFCSIRDRAADRAATLRRCVRATRGRGYLVRFRCADLCPAV